MMNDSFVKGPTTSMILDVHNGSVIEKEPCNGSSVADSAGVVERRAAAFVSMIHISAMLEEKLDALKILAFDRPMEWR